jgi:MFS family permease
LDGNSPRISLWPAIWAVYAGGLVAGAYITKVPPALPALRGELSLALVESGFIATMFNLMGGLVGMLAGVVCDRYGQKRLALMGLAVMALGGLIGAAALDYPSLLVARFLEGVGFIAFTVSAPALIAYAAEAPGDRARAFALWSSYMPAGGAASLLVAPLAIAAFGWRGLWVLLVLAAAGSLLLVLRYVEAPRHGEVGSLKLALESLRQPGSVALALLFACYVAQWTSVMIWLPTFLVDERAVSEGTASLAAAAMVLANVPGNLGGGWLLARGISRGVLVVCAFAVMAVCSAGMLLPVLPDTVRFLLVLAFSMCAGVIPAAIFSGVPVHARTPQHIGTTNGMVMQSSQAAQFIAPIVLAWLATRFGGWGATLWAMLALAAGGAACGFAIGRIERRAGDAAVSAPGLRTP